MQKLLGVRDVLNHFATHRLLRRAAPGSGGSHDMHAARRGSLRGDTRIAPAVVSILLLAACPATPDAPAASSPTAIESVRTDLSPPTCRKEIDRSDPNETPFLTCPGVGGYSLVVRRVDAGRQSIDVVDPSQRRFPLAFDQFVTRRMSNLDDKAEWRVATKNGKQVPVALMVRVQAREDGDHPEKVTRTYVAVAKIAANEACVTAREPEDAQSPAEVLRSADSAQERPCVAALPHVTVDGVVVR